jgi:hypothetical protein
MDAIADGSPALAVAEVAAVAGCGQADAAAWVDHFMACCRSWPFDADDERVLRQIDASFGAVARPVHFTNFAHCDECREHDDTLRARPRERLRRKDLGNVGWDPVSFTHAQGVAHLMPTLARFALMPARRGHDAYGDQLLLHLARGGAENEFLRWCNAGQRQAVGALLRHMAATRGESIVDGLVDGVPAHWQSVFL